MYVQELKKDFYDFIAGKRILLVANYDVDSVCTCKILQALLRQKYCTYTLEVVKGVDDLKRVYQENFRYVKNFLLINCGGTIDILECLEAEEDVIFFILDAHRPTDVYNIYNADQVRLLWRPDEDINVPKLEEIDSQQFEDSESGEESEDEDNDVDEALESRAAKRQKIEERIIKRRQQRIWEENRSRVLSNYTQYSYYTYPSAIAMFKFAWKLSKDDKDSLWYAVIALADYELFYKIEPATYIMESSELHSHSVRMRNHTIDLNFATSIKVDFTRDVRLVLYRHWNIEKSLKYSMLSACRLKLWSVKGEAVMHELLADMGFPLVEARQNFSSMELELRNEFLNKLDELSEKYELTDILYNTFTLSYGYRNKFCASDYVYALVTLLDASGPDREPQECFQLAMDCLSRSKKELLLVTIENSKNVITTLFKTVQNALESKKIISAGPYLYYIIQEGFASWQQLSQPNILYLLAQFLLRAYVSSSTGKKAKTLPLLVSAPSDMGPGMCVLLGLPSLSEDSTKSVFGEAFQQVSQNINCDTYPNYFDPSYIHLHIKDRTRFLDGLTAIVW